MHLPRALLLTLPLAAFASCTRAPAPEGPPPAAIEPEPAPEPRAAADDPRAPFALVELFTSEGCSSCPPADALLAEVASEPRVFALSFHVDYWDELGWKDPFSSAAYTAHQRAHADAIGRAGLFTPEMIVGGAEHVNGHDADGLHRAVDAALSASPEATVSLKVDEIGQSVAVRWEVGDAPRGATLALALVERERTVHVGAGENAGRTLRHVGIVRAFDTAPLERGASHGARTLSPHGRAGALDVVAWVEDPSLRAVGAARAAASSGR